MACCARHWRPANLILNEAGSEADSDPLAALQKQITAAAELALAQQLIDGLRGTFDPGELTSDYRRDLRVLLAEDNVVNQKVALSMLQKLGFRADVAANGLEVIAAVERQPYDVILMDVQMPEMDGLEASRRLGQLRPDPAQRPWIIALTANAMQGDREMCLAAGMDDYISKPIKRAELLAAIERAHARTRT